MRAKRGVTFVEILASLVILGILITGLLNVFLLCFQWNDASREMLIAMAEVQSKLEEIRASPYDLIPAAYSPAGTPGNTFALTGINGTGVIFVNNANSDLLNIRVAACWRGTRNGRMFGEDANLNGVLDAGEDANNNGLLDSQASLTMPIARR